MSIRSTTFFVAGNLTEKASFFAGVTEISNSPVIPSEVEGSSHRKTAQHEWVRRFLRAPSAWSEWHAGKKKGGSTPSPTWNYSRFLFFMKLRMRIACSGSRLARISKIMEMVSPYSSVVLLLWHHCKKDVNSFVDRRSKYPRIEWSKTSHPFMVWGYIPLIGGTYPLNN